MLQLHKDGFVIQNTNQTIGYCRECQSDVKSTDKIPGYAAIYECPICGYPNVNDDLIERLEGDI